MNPNDTLSLISLLGFGISFIAGVTSQLWKSSVEVEGRLLKKLTPAGWLLFAIAIVSLSASIAAELIRVNIRSREQIQLKAEAAQKRALAEQERSWREDVRAMLAAAKHGIEENLR